MNPALEFELVKARRSPVFRWGAAVVVIGVPALTVGFFQLARTGGRSSGAVKAAAMVPSFDAAGLLQLSGQVLSVAMLLVVGIAVSWSFGREFVDDAVPALFAIATTRPAIAAAKFVVLLGWAVLAVVTTVGIAVAAGAMMGLRFDEAAWVMVAHTLVTGGLSALLAAPMGLVASWRRGYLGGFVALLSVVVITQVVTAVGVGGWFPYAAPSLWMGMGGAAAADQVTLVQLLTPVGVGAVAVAATVVWWRHAEAI